MADAAVPGAPAAVRAAAVHGSRGHGPVAGGPLVTAGGLVFIGAAMDERFHASDKATGKLLWEFQMEAGGYATPATYEVDGRQFVVIAAGGGGKPETRPGNAFHAVAIGS